MASLTTTARAARVDAARLRNEAKELKLAVRGNVARSRERVDRAKAQAGRARMQRAAPCGSPWSGLEWLRDDEKLGRVLVPLD